MDKVWVFLLVEGGIVQDVRIVSEDMERVITAYAVEATIESMARERSDYLNDPEDAWAEVYEDMRDSENTDASLRLVTVGDLTSEV